MNSLRHFTIRRVVLWMMIVSLGIVVLAGGDSSQVVRDIFRQTDCSAVLTQQLSFLAHSAIVMQSGTPADKNALVASTRPMLTGITSARHSRQLPQNTQRLPVRSWTR